MSDISLSHLLSSRSLGIGVEGTGVFLKKIVPSSFLSKLILHWKSYFPIMSLLAALSRRNKALLLISYL